MPADLDDFARLERARGGRMPRWVAGALTPANVVLALMAYVSLKYSSSVLAAVMWWTIAVALVVGVPYLILFRALRTGKADDRQVVRRSQRPALFAAAAVAVGGALILLFIAGAPRQLVWLIAAMLCGLAAMGITTIWWKASMHMAVAAGAVAVVFIENHTAGLIVALLLPVLGWARWKDGRHSVAQLIGGALIGAVVAGVVYGILS
jgi:hypothetical protein